MSLGGYKFVGYKCARPSGYVVGDTTSETNWVLLVHKTRVKAFMDSCALSGAQWTFNHTQGQFSLESYGNVIYRLDDVGYNYASFFKCGSSDAYYLILTAGYWDVGSSDLSAGKISLSRMLKTANNNSNNSNSNCCNKEDNFYIKKKQYNITREEILQKIRERINSVNVNVLKINEIITKGIVAQMAEYEEQKRKRKIRNNIYTYNYNYNKT